MNTGTALIAFVATAIISALILTPLHWPLGFALWVVIAAASLLLVVRWHAENTVYRCPECGQLFSVGALTDLVSPHGLGRGGGWKLLTCPRCGSHVRARAHRKGAADTPT